MKKMGFGLFTLALAAVLYAAELPVAVTRLVTGSDSRVELINNGNQPATAWTVVITTEGDGRVHRVIQTRDTYIAEVTRGLPGSLEELDWLLPGGTRQMTLDTVATGASAEVIAVVMDDGTSVGDASAIQSIFDRRAAERDALRTVVEAFRSALTNKKGVAALEDLKERLGPPSEGSATADRSASDAVEKFLRQATAGAENDADQAVRTYAAFVERQYEVAVKHARQKF